MMFENQLPDLLLIATAAAFGVIVSSVIWMIRIRHIRRRLEEHVAERNKLNEKLNATWALAVRSQRLYKKTASQVSHLCERMNQLETNALREDYSVALDLVNAGANEDELIHKAGVNKGEAHLLALIHNRTRDS